MVEQEKNRKRLISRYSKKTILSNLDMTHFKLLWPFLYACAIPLTVMLISYHSF